MTKPEKKARRLSDQNLENESTFHQINYRDILDNLSDAVLVRSGQAIVYANSACLWPLEPRLRKEVLLGRVIAIFRHELPKSIGLLRAAIEKNDFAASVPWHIHLRDGLETFPPTAH
jgi:hypothetical protein